MSNKVWDPLEGFGEIQNLYNLEEIVFAEPLEILNIENSLVTNEQTFVEDILVEKKNGRRNKKYHIAIENMNIPVCPKESCNKTFASITLLKAHVRKIHCSKKEFICEQCGRGFTAKYLLNRHSIIHKLVKRPCPVCKKELSARTKMSDHLNTHTNARTHTCHVCAKAFTRKSVLDRHRLKIHRDKK